MKKVTLLSFLLTALCVPQLALAGGDSEVNAQSSITEQITSVALESSTEVHQGSMELGVEIHDSTNHNRSLLFFLFSEVPENEVYTAVIRWIELVGALLLAAGVSFFIYKYYRKNQEINDMLGIQKDGSDLDETTKIE